MLSASYSLDAIDGPVDDAVALLVGADALTKLFAQDASLYGEGTPEVADRMGWVDIAARSRGQWDQLVAESAAIAGDVDDVVLMGMGGSSLFPEVLTTTFGPASGHPRLHVIDTTAPGAIARLAASVRPERTFLLASSKSGSTVETRSHLAYFTSLGGSPDRTGVVTDPGSGLEADARAAGFAHVWAGDPHIGGRYSALSAFGVVPGALLGVDGATILDAALDQTDAIEPLGDDAELNVALRLGAAIGAAAANGRNQLTMVIDERMTTFGLWLEQLVAESLGKHGVGAIPVVGERLDHVAATPAHRLVVGIGDVDLSGIDAPTVSLSMEETTDIGAHVVLWEVAVALAGKVLGINPFDQPDVEAAKAAARRLLDGGAPPEPPEVDLDAALAEVTPEDTLVICAFVDPGGPHVAAIEAARHALGERLGVATTLGYGPRFLHSTGQLHKGGPHSVVVVQVIEPPAGSAGGPADVDIPGQPFSFGTLLRAQAAGDLEALHAAGKRAHRVALDSL